MSTVIVTGGCGYIGSHIARAFKQEGHTVHIVDRVLREHTLKDIDGYLIDDYASDAALAMIRMLEPDVLVHCAGTSLVGPSLSNPSEYYNNNVIKTIQMLDVIKEMKKMPLIMFSSSASVYGEPETVPIDECSEIRPITPYGVSKAIIERTLRDYHHAYNLHSVCFRYFNAAGAEPFNFDLGQEPGATHIVARVLEASLSNALVTINGMDFDTEDGTCVRDYIHVWDIARAHVMAYDHMQTRLHNGYTVFNLGTNLGTSNLEIINYVAQKYGLEDVKVGVNRLGDPDTLIADATLVYSITGWEPLYSDIGTIIDSAYKWYTNEHINHRA